MSDSEDDSETGPSTVNSKVSRVMEEYGLDDMGLWLERQWTGDGVDRQSLRDLADAFNRAVLKAAMESEGMDPLQNNVDGAYDMLTSDDASSGARVDLRNRLEWNGIDVESLESDFVSHQAVYTYLTRERGVERGQSETDPREKGLQTIGGLQGRTQAVTTDTLERLADRGLLEPEEFDVFVDVRVICDNCGSQYQASEFVEQGGCGCQ